MKAFSPTGIQIIGTLEQLSGRAEILPNSFRELDDGGFECDYAGHTQIFWEEQKTVTRQSNSQEQIVYLDEEGGEWTEDQLVLAEDEDDSEVIEPEDQSQGDVLGVDDEKGDLP